ncbi:hypothetical protein CI610_01177 [invertebrate metagenome]|uniref:Uncharacterized protein n=1 Tax=invertebrate metagenome TaxID=1711999 RepID=A0A2H9T993_9ZZZZ
MQKSCKIFAFVLLHKLTKEQILHCFGNYYKKEVLADPDGVSSGNFENASYEAFSIRSAKSVKQLTGAYLDSCVQVVHIA